MWRFSFRELLKSRMEILGGHIAKRPSVFIFISCVASIILGMGIVTSVYEILSIKHVEIIGSKFEGSKRMLTSLFPMNLSRNFDPLRSVEFPSGPIIFIIHKNGNNMLDKSVLKEIEHLDKTVREVSIVTESGPLNYAKLCAKNSFRCYDHPIRHLIQNADGIMNGTFKFVYPINIDLERFSFHAYAINLGGVTKDNKGYVEKVEAVRLFYFGDDNNINTKKYIRKWEAAVNQEVEKLRFNTIEVFTTFISQIGEDIHEANQKLIPLAGIVVATMIVFSMVAFVTNSSVKSKPWMGFASAVTAGLAIISAYGMVFYAGLKSSDFVVAIYFVVLGTEIDDSFVLVASWRATNAKDSVEARMAKTYSEAAVSITVSSITSFLAYCVGSFTPVLLIRNVCIQCAACMFFTYLFQILFFGPLLALDGYREEKNRHALTFHRVAAKEEKCDKGGKELHISEKESLMKFIQETLGRLLRLPAFKVVCILLFIVHLTLTTLSAFNLRKGLEVPDITLEGSTVSRAFEIQEIHFKEYQYPLHIVLNKTLNYWEPQVEQSVENMLARFENHPNIAPADVTVSWLKYYKIFTSHPMVKASLIAYNISNNRENFINGLRKAYLRFRLTRQFASDLNFNQNYTEITSSRFLTFIGNLNTIDAEIKFTEEINTIVKNSEFPISAYSPVFVKAEQGLIMVKITMQTIWITSVLMFIIFLLFVANFSYALLVAICVTSSMIGTIGLMAAWGVKLDFISLIVVIMCLGFSVNYPTHLSHAFAAAQGRTSHEKLDESLYHVGLPIIQGSFSTILSVTVLAFQNIYIFDTWFKVIFLIVMETCFHSLFLLPVALCFFHTYVNCKSNKEEKSQSVKKSFNFLGRRTVYEIKP